ncbi:hypothetical protein [Galbibacter sp. PAP.153]|uniref:hypothetical protein n=1 Tax=Galbibacter sp. PAP.153 TaxID=3104623 RepID=UPI003008E6EC
MKRLFSQINFSFTTCIALSLFFFSCEKEDIGDLSQKGSHPSFSLLEFSDKFVKENLIVDWNEYIAEVDSSSGQDKYLYNTSLKSSSTLYDNEQKWGQLYKLLAEKDSLSNWNYTLLEFLSVKDSILPNNLSISNTTSFTGTLYFYDLKGNVKKIESYEDGLKMTEFINKKQGKVTLQSKAPKVCGGYNPFCEDGTTVTYITVSVSTYTDHYNVREGGRLDYSYSTYDGTKTKWIAVPVNDPEPTVGSYVHHHVDDPNLNHGSGSSGSNHPKDVIVDSSASPCIDGIIGQLKLKDKHVSVVPDILGSEGASHLSQIILDIFDNSDKYMIKFLVKEAGTDSNGAAKNAQTLRESDGNGGFIMTITIDDDYIKNATKLALARTIIHESLHAYLGYVLQNNYTSNTASLLHTYYSKYGNGNIAEHTFMSQYVEALGYSLAAWDNHKQSQEYYNNLAWSGGLLSTDAYNKLSGSKKTAILNANRAEGNAIYKSTSQAKGIRCN